jgi:hypothetical protein
MSKLANLLLPILPSNAAEILQNLLSMSCGHTLRMKLHEKYTETIKNQAKQ